MMKRATISVLLVVCFASCLQGAEETRHASLEASNAATEPAPTPAPAPTEGPIEEPSPVSEEHRVKRATSDGPTGPIAEDVDWAEVAGVERVDPALLPASERAKLDAIEVPVLLPDDGRLLATAFMSHHENWYTAAMEVQGAHVYIRGTRNAFKVPAMDIPAAAAAAADNYTLTRTHQIVTVSWRSFNVSYSLDVECAKPMDDTRCTEDEFALKLAERLGVVNPQAAGESEGVQ